MRGRAIVVVLALLLSACAAVDRAAADFARAVRMADSIAAVRAAGSAVDARRVRLEALEDAVHAAPRRADVALALGLACLDAGRPGRARWALARAAALAPGDADMHHALGLAWHRDWLLSTDVQSIDRARGCFARAIDLEPARVDALVELAAIDVLRGRPREAAALARRAITADSTSGDARLALGAAMFRCGAIDTAQAAFDRATRLLRGDARARFTDLRWVLQQSGALPKQYDARVAASFWRDQDPDLTTPENEAQLDFQSRLALALLLFRDQQGVRWDMRAELFIRYGPPPAVELNPIDSPLAYHYERHGPAISWAQSYAPPPLEYPYNAQVWSYPDLGLKFEMWDMALSQDYRPAIATGRDTDPRAEAAALESRPDLASIAGGLMVLKTMPPTRRPMPVECAVTRYPGARGVRLVANVSAPGGPADAMHAACAVVDARGTVLARVERTLSVSACDPGERKFGEMAFDVPPGDYRVHVSVDDGRGARGLARRTASCPPLDERLVLSDVVRVCGGDAAAVQGGTVRIEPDLGGRIRGSRPLSLYFELDHLAPDADGLSRFTYTYTVMKLPENTPHPERGGAAMNAASRDETNAGPLRRQFVTVPTAKLKPGRYRVDIEVRDTVNGASATAAVGFVKE